MPFFNILLVISSSQLLGQWQYIELYWAGKKSISQYESQEWLGKNPTKCMSRVKCTYQLMYVGKKPNKVHVKSQMHLPAYVRWKNPNKVHVQSQIHLPAYVRWEKTQQSACPESNTLTSLCTLGKPPTKCMSRVKCTYQLM